MGYSGEIGRWYSGYFWDAGVYQISAFHGTMYSDGNQYTVAGGRENVQGNPTQPSLKMDAKGSWKFRWAVTSGNHTITVNTMQDTGISRPRPSLSIRPNPEIGITGGIGTADNVAGWTTIGPVNINASGNGVVWVELKNNYDCQWRAVPCFWDHIVTT